MWEWQEAQRVLWRLGGVSGVCDHVLYVLTCDNPLCWVHHDKVFVRRGLGTLDASDVADVFVVALIRSGGVRRRARDY